MNVHPYVLLNVSFSYKENLSLNLVKYFSIYITLSKSSSTGYIARGKLIKFKY